MHGDLQSRLDAYSHAHYDPEADLPSQWTPEHVGKRMIEAFEVLSRMPGRVGPKQPGNAWPTILREFSDFIGVIVEEQPTKARPTAPELSRMNEAFSWPLKYLREEPLQADALNLWAFCKAIERPVSSALHKRMKTAREAAKALTEREDVLKAIERREIAVNISKWTNDRLAQAVSPEESEKIRAEAHERFTAACDAAGLRTVIYTEKDTAKGLVLTRRALDKYRHLAAAQIALRLREQGVMVR